MSVSGREFLPDVWKARLNVRECLRGPPGYPVVVGRPSRMSGSGREALSDVWEWSGGPPVSLVVVGSLSRMSGSCHDPSSLSESGR